jgi:LEA14-like dessication related protein
MRAERVVRCTRHLAPLIMLAALGGCAWLAPKLQSPRVRVIGVHVRSADFWQQRLRVRLRVRNPNGTSLPIEAIRYTLRIDGRTFANGRTVRRFDVPAHGSAEFNTYVTANMAGALLRILSGGRKRPVRYRLRGEVEVAYDLLRELPFDAHGQFFIR